MSFRSDCEIIYFQKAAKLADTRNQLPHKNGENHRKQKNRVYC